MADAEDKKEYVLFLPDAKFVSKDRASVDKEERWSHDHCKVLYLIALYARCSSRPEKPDGWARKNPLYTMIYEGIVAGSLDFDYAPRLLTVFVDGASKKEWMNVSQVRLRIADYAAGLRTRARHGRMHHVSRQRHHCSAMRSPFGCPPRPAAAVPSPCPPCPPPPPPPLPPPPLQLSLRRSITCAMF
jgi:hypothetical protein